MRSSCFYDVIMNGYVWCGSFKLSKLEPYHRKKNPRCAHNMRASWIRSRMSANGSASPPAGATLQALL